MVLRWLDLSQDDWKSVNVLLNCGAPVKRNLEVVWPHLPNLEWLHSTAAGVEHILFPALVDGPVILTNAKVGGNIYQRLLGVRLCQSPQGEPQIHSWLEKEQC